MSRSKFEAAFAAGGRPLGAFVMSSDPAMTAIFGEVGYDFVVADMEHGRVDMTNLLNHIYAARASGAAPLVRVPANEPSIIQRSLDSGASGIVVPKVSRADDARSAVAASRYAPGGRGKCPIVPATGFTRANWDDFEARSNNDIIVMPIIETARAVAEISEICAVDGIDYVFFGHADLGQDVGMTPASHPEEFRAMWERVRAATTRHGVKLGAPYQSSFDNEADFATIATDVGSVRDLAESMLSSARTVSEAGIEPFVAGRGGLSGL
ncbi:MAG: aldolase/citrate lyase family protein [Mycetocola sp.]